MIFAFNTQEAKAGTIGLHGMGSDCGNSCQTCSRRTGWWRWYRTERYSCNCTKKRSCGTHNDYWGSTPLAAKPQYNTETYDWRDSYLQNQYAAKVRGYGKATAHSMGNTILAAAANNGKSLGGKKWNNSQGPIMGSDAANKADPLCNEWYWKWNVGALVNAFGFCTNATYSLRTDRGQFSNSHRNAARNNINASMCGANYSCTRSGNAFGMCLISATFVSGDDDGLVPYWSCNQKNTSRVGLDHEQGTGRTGNSTAINFIK